MSTSETDLHLEPVPQKPAAVLELLAKGHYDQGFVIHFAKADCDVRTFLQALSEIPAWPEIGLSFKLDVAGIRLERTEIMEFCIDCTGTDIGIENVGLICNALALGRFPNNCQINFGYHSLTDKTALALSTALISPHCPPRLKIRLNAHTKLRQSSTRTLIQAIHSADHVPSLDLGFIIVHRNWAQDLNATGEIELAMRQHEVIHAARGSMALMQGMFDANNALSLLRPHKNVVRMIVARACPNPNKLMDFRKRLQLIRDTEAGRPPRPKATIFSDNVTAFFYEMKKPSVFAKHIQNALPRMWFHHKRVLALLAALTRLRFSPTDCIAIIDNQLACYGAEAGRPPLPAALRGADVMNPQQLEHLEQRFKRRPNHPPRGRKGYYDLLIELKALLSIEASENQEVIKFDV